MQYLSHFNMLFRSSHIPENNFYLWMNAIPLCTCFTLFIIHSTIIRLIGWSHFLNALPASVWTLNTLRERSKYCCFIDVEPKSQRGKISYCSLHIVHTVRCSCTLSGPVDSGTMSLTVLPFCLGDFLVSKEVWQAFNWFFCVCCFLFVFFLRWGLALHVCNTYIHICIFILIYILACYIWYIVCVL